MLRRRTTQVVELGRHLGRHGGAARVVVRQARAVGGRARLDQRRARQVGRQPAPALRRPRPGSSRRARSRPSVDAGAREQAHVHLERDLGADLEIAVEEGVEGVDDAALGRVLDGDHAEVGVAALDLLEHGRDGADGRRARRQAELLLDRHVRERPLGAEVGDAHPLLQRQAGAEDLLEHRADRLGRERARGWRPTAARRSGARARGRRTAPRARVLRSATSADQAGALVEQRQDLVVGARRSPARSSASSLRRALSGPCRVLGHGAGAYYTGRMRLATLRDGTRDGALVVVGARRPDAARAPRGVAPTLQAALDDWDRAAPALAALAARLDAGARPAEPLDADAPRPAAAARLRVDRRLGVPQPRPARAQGARRRAARRRWRPIRSSTRAARACCSARATTSRSPIRPGASTSRAEVAVILGDVPRGTRAADAARARAPADARQRRHAAQPGPRRAGQGLRLLPVEAGDRLLAVRGDARRARRRLARRARAPARCARPTTARSCGDPDAGPRCTSRSSTSSRTWRARAPSPRARSWAAARSRTPTARAASPAWPSGARSR